jgi:hypothetical protein
VRHGALQRLRREPHAVAVAVDEVGGLERAPQLRVLGRLVEHVRVRVHDTSRRPAVAASRPAGDAAQQLVRATEVDRDVEDQRQLARVDRDIALHELNGGSHVDDRTAS